MSPPIKFRRGVFQDAADGYNGQKEALEAAAKQLKSALSGAGGCAGSDDPGQAFAKTYDPAARSALDGMTMVINATGGMHDLLQQSAFNYKNANQVDPAKEQADRAVPDWMSSTFLSPNVPSVLGGANKDPGWWETLRSYIGGKIWPNADTDRLSQVGTAWENAASAFRSAASAMGPINATMGGQSVPEAGQINTNGSNLVTAVNQIADNMDAVGKAADAYSHAVTQAHDQLNNEVKHLVELALAAIATGVLLAFVTVGVGAAAGVSGSAGAMTLAATRAMTILDALLGAAAGLGGAGAVAAINPGAVGLQGIQELAGASPIAAQYNAVDATGDSGAYDVTKRRVKLRNSTKEEIKQNARDEGLTNADGDFIDPNTGAVIPKDGPFDYGHKPGMEHWRIVEKAREEGWTRQELVEYENNPDLYEIEDPAANRSHAYEVPREK
ncbi:HNH/ENDO VII family nuclease [Williamsia sterculiae]|uniref:HNH/ENDO VII superfamily nuclease with conserved GHE residues n=1 Tax=Williamsia sterculiae TaxID=1344003 RepID=A0A1N7GGM0_9NOCA|nr:HNH/ENDO VII family nuclease [Williamsia sterculiae]SIS11731.1 HNH/ENDO VII superfamily nuclease with conserved GHE residues [Williamsia sterculiae]